MFGKSIPKSLIDAVSNIIDNTSTEKFEIDVTTQNEQMLSEGYSHAVTVTELHFCWLAVSSPKNGAGSQRCEIGGGFSEIQLVESHSERVGDYSIVRHHIDPNHRCIPRVIVPV